MSTQRNAHGLTPREEMFCREYVIDFDGQRAARAAGYSRDSAATRACELLNDLRVVCFIGELLAGQHERQRVDQDQLVRMYETAVTADRRRLVDEDGNYKRLSEIDEELAGLIEGYKITDKGVEVKLISRAKAMRDLGEIMALFKTVEVVVDERRSVLTDEERKRIDEQLDREF